MRELIIFTFGVVAGGSVATLFWREKWRDKYRKEADEKVQSMKEYVDELRKYGDPKGETNNQLQYMKTEINSNTSSRTEKDRNAYTKYSDIYCPTPITEKELAEMEHPTDDAEEDLNKMTSTMEPRIIRADEYEGVNWYDRVCLLYYQEDGVLAFEDTAKPVLDQEQLIGDALTKFGFTDNDEEVIYVRNDNRGSLYEIVKIYGAYTDFH